jgi:hypothetical protein
MDVDGHPPDERTDVEKDIEAWNLPRPALLPTPSLDEWPEREPGFEDGVGVVGRPAA